MHGCIGLEQGIPEGQRARILEPYVRLPRETDPGGLGLGLAISRRIVEAHGGVVRVGASPEGGSCFSFCLEAAAGAESSATDRGGD